MAGRSWPHPLPNQVSCDRFLWLSLICGQTDSWSV